MVGPIMWVLQIWTPNLGHMESKVISSNFKMEGVSTQWEVALIAFTFAWWKTTKIDHKLPISWNFTRIHVKIVKQYVCAKSMGFKVFKWHEKYVHYFYINDVSFLLMMSWCEVCMLYILTKSMQLLWYNFA
jgi:hypothetical protein